LEEIVVAEVEAVVVMDPAEAGLVARGAAPVGHAGDSVPMCRPFARALRAAEASAGAGASIFFDAPPRILPTFFLDPRRRIDS